MRSNPIVIESAPAARPQGVFPKILGCLVLALVTVALYAPVRHYGFLKFDDDKYITGDADVVHGFTVEGLGRAFIRFHFCNWHPLTTLSQMLDCQLWGLDAGGHHLTNVIIHALNTLLLFLVLSNMTGATWRSALVAALFAWHPLHVESVAWISDRKDLLSTFFLMLTLGAYLWYVRRPQWHRYLLVFTCYTLGLMSKATLATLPLVLLLLDYWPLGRWNLGENGGISRATPRPFRVLVWEKVPFCLLAGVFSVVAILAQQSGGALSSLERLPFLNRLANALINYSVYALKTIWPNNLAIPYPMPPGIALWKTVASGLALVLTTTLIVRARRYSPFLVVGWFWYLVTLLPVIGLVQVGAQTLADRYTYVPLIGLFIMVSWSAAQVLEEVQRQRTIATVGAAAVLALCVTGTTKQLRYWIDGIALFEHTLSVTSLNPMAHESLAVALRDQGRSSEAIQHHERALEIKPDFAEAHNNLGDMLAAQGRVSEAVGHFEKALEFNPDFVEAHNNLGSMLANAGQTSEAIRHFQAALEVKPDCAEAHYNWGNVLADQKQYAGAIRHFEQAIEIKPDFARAHYNLGLAFAAQGQFVDAIQHYRKAFEIKPNYAEAHNNLAHVLAQQGNVVAAIEQYQRALQIKPDFAEAHNNLGGILVGQGRSIEAIEHFKKAVEIKPDFAEAHYNLGILLVAQGRTSEAMRHFQEAIEAKPDYAEAHYNLGSVLGGQKRYAEAIRHYQKAFEIKPDYAEAHNNLANVFALQGNVVEAIEHYQQALQIKPDFAECHNNLGSILAGQGRSLEAVEHFKKAVEVKPDFAEAHFNLGVVLATQGQAAAAIEHYRQAIKINPVYPEAHAKLGLALKDQGKFEAAITHYEKALELEPRYLSAQNNLAWLLATCPDNSLRNGQKAVELSQKAVQLSGGKHPEILDTLAAAYAEAGRFSEAVETVKRALNLPATQNNQPLADALQMRLKLYEANSPFHEKP